jgi:hypothetical protein
VYIVWSKTWALDVHADVPESSIGGWRDALDAGGERGLRAVVAMGRLPDPQLATAIRAIGATRLMTSSVLKVYRFLAALPDGVLHSALKGSARLWRPSPTVMGRATEVLGEPAREPIALSLRREPDGSAYLLELTSGGHAAPATVRIPVRSEMPRRGRSASGS